jgi:hypothetical protein
MEWEPVRRTVGSGAGTVRAAALPLATALVQVDAGQGRSPQSGRVWGRSEGWGGGWQPDVATIPGGSGTPPWGVAVAVDPVTTVICPIPLLAVPPWPSYRRFGQTLNVTGSGPAESDACQRRNDDHKAGP